MLRRFLLSLILLFSVTTTMSALMPTTVYAQDIAQGVCAAENPDFLGFPTWYKYLTKAPGPNGKCEITFDVMQDSGKILLAVFEIILRIGGIAAVGFIIFGGFQYLISQGEPDRTKGAKSTILNAVIGLAITISATAIVNLIGNNIA